MHHRINLLDLPSFCLLQTVIGILLLPVMLLEAPEAPRDWLLQHCRKTILEHLDQAQYHPGQLQRCPIRLISGLPKLRQR